MPALSESELDVLPEIVISSDSLSSVTTVSTILRPRTCKRSTTHGTGIIASLCSLTPQVDCEWSQFVRLSTGETSGACGSSRRGKPRQNGLDESFNSRFRDECLNAEWFHNRLEATAVIARFRDE